MKKNLEIIEFEHKITKAGKPFMRFQTSEGWMSCFDTKSCEALQKFKGTTASVGVMESGDFSNIKKCYGEASGEEEGEDNEEVEVEKHPTKKATNGNSINQNVYTSYAKDIFCGLVEDKTNMTINQEPKDLMNVTIDLVKQAKEAFE